MDKKAGGEDMKFLIIKVDKDLIGVDEVVDTVESYTEAKVVLINKTEESYGNDLYIALSELDIKILQEVLENGVV